MTDSTMPSGAAANGRPALARCLSVSPDEFASTYWSQRPLLSPAATLRVDAGCTRVLAALSAGSPWGAPRPVHS